MPQLRQPLRLFEIALPITAGYIRAQCNAILSQYGDVTQPAFQERLELLNKHLVRSVPQNVLDNIRVLKNLAGFIHLNATTLTIEEKTFKNTSMHQHFVVNLLPMLNNVTYLDLRKVEGTLELFQAISVNCKELKAIYVNTRLMTEKLYSNDFQQYCQHWGDWLLLLTSCKKLQVIHDGSKNCSRFDVLAYTDNYKYVTACLLQDLPDLKVFNFYKTSSALTRIDKSNGVFQLTRLDLDNDSFETAQELNWLNTRCPLITVLDLHVNDVSKHDTVFNALADTDFKIETLLFPAVMPRFSEAVKKYFTNKGSHLQTLYLYFFNDEIDSSLSYDNIIHISKYCPILKKLSLNGSWYDGAELTPVQRRTQGLFPSLEHFGHDLDDTIESFILEELINLKHLRCTVTNEVSEGDYLEYISSLRNQFKYLQVLEIESQVEMNVDESFTFIKRILTFALPMPNINIIRIESTIDINRISHEAQQYFQALQKQINENNLNLGIAIKYFVYVLLDD